MDERSRIGGILYDFAQQANHLAFVLLDPEGEITWWSKGAERVLGYAPDEVMGKPLRIIFTPHDIQRGMPEQELATAARDHPAEDDRWQQRKDGSRFWASGVLVGLRDERGEVRAFAKMMRNRTDQRELTETLTNKVAALEDARRRADTFLSTLSHELANPLAPLVNAARIIRQSASPTGEVEFALRVIERQTQLLRTLVTDLLEFSRVGAGKIELKPTRCSVQEIVEAAANDCRPMMDERRHTLQLLMPPGPILLDADRERLHQVVVNLITNAAKYTHPGGRISVKATVEGHEAVIRIEDTGVGIAHDMLPRIFDLFTQVEETRPMSLGGMGIGLALVKELVSLHGGTVQVLSEGRGKGSEFTIRLPLPPGEGN